MSQISRLTRLSRLGRLSQFLLLLAGGFTTALLIAVYLESQLAAIATWWFFYALVPVILVWIVVFIVRRVRGHLSDGSRSESFLHEPEKAPSETDSDALATLRERYARGELTDDQFEQKLDNLLEADTPENAAEWREESHDQGEENHWSEFIEWKRSSRPHEGAGGLVG